MGDLSSTVTIREVNSIGSKHLEVYTPATADTGDTFAIDLASYGGRLLKGIIGFIHSTAHSIVVQEQPTTSVSTTTVTVTVGGTAADDQARFYKIMYW
uniref:Tail protein n=1 Tax=viral metagenome TaxID=1070528 RepID=A0A6M3L9W7_9ZZZZ